MKIGFIGTGTMGQPMLANLVKKGFEVVAFDVVPGALDAAVRLGAARAGATGEAAANCDLVITMLPSSANVEAAYLGEGGIIASAPAGRLCVDMSTIDPGTSQRGAAPPLGHWRSWSAALPRTSKKRGRRSRRWAATSSTSAPSGPARSPSCATT